MVDGSTFRPDLAPLGQLGLIPVASGIDTVEAIILVPGQHRLGVTGMVDERLRYRRPAQSIGRGRPAQVAGAFLFIDRPKDHLVTLFIGAVRIFDDRRPMWTDPGGFDASEHNIRVDLPAIRDDAQLGPHPVDTIRRFGVADLRYLFAYVFAQLRIRAMIPFIVQFEQTVILEDRRPGTDQMTLPGSFRYQDRFRMDRGRERSQFDAIRHQPGIGAFGPGIATAGLDQRPIDKNVFSVSMELIDHFEPTGEGWVADCTEDRAIYNPAASASSTHSRRVLTSAAIRSSCLRASSRRAAGDIPSSPSRNPSTAAARASG
jgi:hypothetical protein